MSIRTLILINLFAFTALSATAEDWPQWRGPERNGCSAESDLLQVWPIDGPPVAWVNHSCGHGYSSIAVVDNRIYTMGVRVDLSVIRKDPKGFMASQTLLIALDAETGNEVWATELDQMFFHQTSFGPRSTPTVKGDRVYALTGSGTVACLSLDGKMMWQQRLTDFGGAVPTWGYSESVFVNDKLLICSPGGTKGAIIAFDRITGEKVWQTSECHDGASYSSMIKISDKEPGQLIQVTDSNIVSISEATGKLLWSTPWQDRTATTPIASDRHVFVTSKNNGCTQLHLESAQDPTVTFQNKNMKNEHGGAVLVAEHLFGYGENRGWVCQNWRTGELAWNEKTGLGRGSLTYADRRLYCLTERDGIIALISATPDGFRELSRFKLKAQTEFRTQEELLWTHPVISNGKLYIRDHEHITAFDIRKRR